MNIWNRDQENVYFRDRDQENVYFGDRDQDQENGRDQDRDRGSRWSLVTGLEFSYSQAPESMKSVLQAAWLLTVAFGSISVITVAEAKAFNDQAFEFFMFACLMLVDIGIG